MFVQRILPGLLTLLLVPGPVPGAEDLLTPDEKDRCPVCGMFVARYPAWVTQVNLGTGEPRYFDGPKDMFKYLFNLEKYEPGRTRDDVAAVHVTGYYALKPVPAAEAWFVKGSDVYGPMGHELVPFATKEDALEFFNDHQGKEIFRLEQITPEVIAELD